jgi:hypothetical protein
MSVTEHLRHWKCNKDNLNSFADRIAQLKKSLTGLLSQQAVQHPGKHTDALAQIESRLAETRDFFAAIRDANEEIAEALLSRQLKQGGEASVRLVSLNYLTAGFLDFLWLRGPGRPPLEAVCWYGRGGRHPQYFKRNKENHSVGLEASPRASRKTLTR